MAGRDHRRGAEYAEMTDFAFAAERTAKAKRAAALLQ